MRRVALLAVALAVSLLLTALAMFPEPSRQGWRWATGPAAVEAETAAIIRRISDRYGVTVDPSPPITEERMRGVIGTEPHPALLRAAVAAVEQVLDIYPQGFASRIGLTRIRLLDFGVTSQTGGFVNSDLGRDTLYLQVVLPTFEATLHHELFHLAEWSAPQDLWESWREFTGHEERYRDKGRLLGLCDTYQFGPPGFARWYGRTTPAEDRATVAERLFADPLLAAGVSEDAVLADKARVIRRFYAAMSDGAMGPAFWNRLPRIEPQRSWLVPLCQIRS